ncbi:lysin [Cylindrospermum sp. NIES-4074]|nr:lysin [Cylindrospermum sp. NIES-4074]
MLPVTLMTDDERMFKKIDIEQNTYPTFLVYGGSLYRHVLLGGYKKAEGSLHIVSPAVRAKFTCQYNAPDPFNQEVTNVIMSPVTDSSKENQAFWKATPAGQINLQLTNPQAVDHFQLGTTHYVDFTLAPEETQTDEDTAIWKPVTTQLPKPGVDLIKEFEGFYPNAYPDPLTKGKPYTIGWGSTRKRDGTRWNLGDTITRDEADELLIYQLETNYLPPLQKIPAWPELNVNQQGALLSFAYNLGANFYGAANFQTITTVLEKKQWNKIESAFLLYCNPGTDVEAGLKRRRQAEARLFLK